MPTPSISRTRAGIFALCAAALVLGPVGLGVVATVAIWRAPQPSDRTRYHWWVFWRILTLLASAGATVGAALGLIVGLRSYPPTAWFAAIELGVGGAAVGVLLGVIAGGAGVLALTINVRSAS